MIERLAALALLLLTLHALWVHTEAGELSPWEVIALEALWAPILLKADCDKRALAVVFAGFSGYFLPRLIPPELFVRLAYLDVVFNNVLLGPLGIKFEVVNNAIAMLVHGKLYAFYAVGCSTLRSGPFLALMPLVARGELKKRIAAAVIGYMLSYPLNALRLAAIVMAGEAFRLPPAEAHVLVSPIASIAVALIVMYLQEMILPGYLEEVAEGVECLLKLAKPW